MMRRILALTLAVLMFGAMAPASADTINGSISSGGGIGLNSGGSSGASNGGSSGSGSFGDNPETHRTDWFLSQRWKEHGSNSRGAGENQDQLASAVNDRWSSAGFGNCERAYDGSTWCEHDGAEVTASRYCEWDFTGLDGYNLARTPERCTPISVSGPRVDGRMPRLVTAICDTRIGGPGSNLSGPYWPGSIQAPGFESRPWLDEKTEFGRFLRWRDCIGQQGQKYDFSAPIGDPGRYVGAARVFSRKGKIAIWWESDKFKPVISRCAAFDGVISTEGCVRLAEDFGPEYQSRVQLILAQLSPCAGLEMIQARGEDPANGAWTDGGDRGYYATSYCDPAGSSSPDARPADAAKDAFSDGGTPDNRAGSLPGMPDLGYFCSNDWVAESFTSADVDLNDKRIATSVGKPLPIGVGRITRVSFRAPNGELPGLDIAGGVKVGDAEYSMRYFLSNNEELSSPRTAQNRVPVVPYDSVEQPSLFAKGSVQRETNPGEVSRFDVLPINRWFPVASDKDRESFTAQFRYKSLPNRVFALTPYVRINQAVRTRHVSLGSVVLGTTTNSGGTSIDATKAGSSDERVGVVNVEKICQLPPVVFRATEGMTKGS